MSIQQKQEGFKMKKNWSQPEIECLRYAYELGATLQNMACLFNRSVTAINKALERFGVRPLGTGHSKISRVRSPKPPLGRLIEALQEFSRKNTLFWEKSTLSFLTISSKLMSSLSILTEPAFPEIRREQTLFCPRLLIRLKR